MSVVGAVHVHRGLLESGLGTGHVWCLGLTRVNSRRSDMSGPGIRYV
jgi:hypothetical protein